MNDRYDRLLSELDKAPNAAERREYLRMMVAERRSEYKSMERRRNGRIPTTLADGLAPDSKPSTE